MPKSLIMACLAAILLALFMTSSEPKEQDYATRLQQLDTKKNEALVIAKETKATTQRPAVSETGPHPTASVKNTTFLFGTMAVSAKNSHRFVLANTGEAVLKMQAGDTTCKCTTFGFVVEGEETQLYTEIAPGEEAVLLVNWKSGDSPDRAFRHGGAVYTNDPDNTEIRLSVEGAVVAAYELLPQSLWELGEIEEGKNTLEAALGSKLYDDLKIVEISCDSEFVQVTHVPMTVEKLIQGRFASGHVLTVSVSEEIPAGIFEADVRIFSSVSEEPIFATVRARRTGAIQLLPQRGTRVNKDTMTLEMGAFSAAEGKKVEFLVIVDEQGMEEPFAITAQKTDPPFLKAALEPVGEPSGTVHRYRLVLDCPAGRPNAQRTVTSPGRIELSTNHPSGDSISLQLHMYSH